LKSTTTQTECLSGTGQPCDGGEMCEPSRQNQRPIGESTCCAADSPAKTSAKPGHGQESTENEADCGQSITGSLAFYDRDSQSWKTPQTSLFGGYIELPATWQRSGTTRNGRLYRAEPLERRIFEDGRFAFATPTVSDNRDNWCSLKRTNNGRSLAQDVGGKPNPTWVEWMMGFPSGWTTVCNASETPSARGLQNGSDDG